MRADLLDRSRLQPRYGLRARRFPGVSRMTAPVPDMDRIAEAS